MQQPVDARLELFSAQEAEKRMHSHECRFWWEIYSSNQNAKNEEVAESESEKIERI